MITSINGMNWVNKMIVYNEIKNNNNFFKLKPNLYMATNK